MVNKNENAYNQFCCINGMFTNKCNNNFSDLCETILINCKRQICEYLINKSSWQYAITLSHGALKFFLSSVSEWGFNPNILYIKPKSLSVAAIFLRNRTTNFDETWYVFDT